MTDENTEPGVNEMSFGTTVAAAPAPVRPMTGSSFRILIVGDFSGRANRGERISSDEIAALRPTPVDFDSLDEKLASFQPRLRIPIASGRSFLDFSFQNLEDFHVDTLFGNIGLIDTVQGIGRRVKRSVEKSLTLFNRWSDAPVPKPHSTLPRGISIPIVDSLSDFMSRPADPAVAPNAVMTDDGSLLEPLCAPYIRPVVASGSPTQPKLAAAAAEATNALVREFLHHPDFQTVEGAWRELDWLLRRTSRESSIEVMLIDLSAEEFAADLSAEGDLTETGLYRLLVDSIAEGIDAAPLAAVVGRYQFDFNSVHSRLLGRVAKIARRLNAPFLTGFTNKLLDADLKIKDKELVKSWMQLRSLPESAWLGIGLPGFLLRMPYGKNGKSVEEFPLEEFTPRAGSRGFLWGNPGTFCAALLVRSYIEAQKCEFDPNQNRVLDQLPLFALHLPNGDSVTFCSEKRFAASTAEQTAALGLIPLQAMKGRDSIVASELRSLNTEDRGLRGPWADPAPATEEATAPDSAATAADSAAPASAPSATDTPADDGIDPELAALLGDSSSTGEASAAPVAAPSDDTGGLDPELAALLGETPAQADAPAPPATQDDDTGLDPELAALLGESPATPDPPAEEPEPAGSADTELDPELAALLGETPAASDASAAEPQPAESVAGELDPELAALLGETPTSTGSAPAAEDTSPGNDDDDGLDPELAALLGD